MQGIVTQNEREESEPMTIPVIATLHITLGDLLIFIVTVCILIICLVLIALKWKQRRDRKRKSDNVGTHIQTQQRESKTIEFKSSNHDAFSSEELYYENPNQAVLNSNGNTRGQTQEFPTLESRFAIPSNSYKCVNRRVDHEDNLDMTSESERDEMMQEIEGDGNKSVSVINLVHISSNYTNVATYQPEIGEVEVLPKRTLSGSV